jgi:hypothetical protein
MRARTDLRLPSNEDFPLEDFALYLPNLAVTRRRGDDTPYYHFYGTDLAKEFGQDLTGQDVTTNMTAEAKEQFLQVIAIAAAQEKQGVAINGRWFVGEVVTRMDAALSLRVSLFPFSPKTARYAEQRTTLSLVVLRWVMNWVRIIPKQMALNSMPSMIAHHGCICVPEVLLRSKPPDPP